MQRYPNKCMPHECLWHTPSDLWERLKPLARQMRHEHTHFEKALWKHLRNRQLFDLKFRRQHPIERFIVDFYCSEAGLIIELDGRTHDYTQEQDAIRQRFLETQGYTVLRFTNEDVRTNIQGVLETIAHTAGIQRPR